jgi:MFS superfamily sulfate permease-like transporter
MNRTGKNIRVKRREKDPFISRIERRRSFLRLMIIFVIVLIFGALSGIFRGCIEGFYNYMDESYRPKDLDRKQYLEQKAGEQKAPRRRTSKQ